MMILSVGIRTDDDLPLGEVQGVAPGSVGRKSPWQRRT
jgi:hypothetical protein